MATEMYMMYGSLGLMSKSQSIRVICESGTLYKSRSLYRMIVTNVIRDATESVSVVLSGADSLEWRTMQRKYCSSRNFVKQT